MTGLRLSELAHATLGDLEPITGKEINDGWMLTVVGKVGRSRRVPMPSALMAALRGTRGGKPEEVYYPRPH